jgi:predicted DNA-binding protein YlxM (UPF0122 family)
MTNKEMLQMRLDGATYQEIADICGISRQAVHEALKFYVKKITEESRGQKFSLKTIKYQGIYDYFKKNENETVASFANKVYGRKSGSCQGAGKLRNFIKGDSDSYFNITQIKKMCEIIGKPFEEVFKEREKE